MSYHPVFTEIKSTANLPMAPFAASAVAIFFPSVASETLYVRQQERLRQEYLSIIAAK